MICPKNSVETIVLRLFRQFETAVLFKNSTLIKIARVLKDSSTEEYSKWHTNLVINSKRGVIRPSPQRASKLSATITIINKSERVVFT